MKNNPRSSSCRKLSSFRLGTHFPLAAIPFGNNIDGFKQDDGHEGFWHMFPYTYVYACTYSCSFYVSVHVYMHVYLCMCIHISMCIHT